jgi:hypothetical protein
MGPTLKERSISRGAASTPRGGSAKSKPTTQTATAFQYPFVIVTFLIIVGRFLSGWPGKVKEIAPLDLKLPGLRN